MSSPIAHCPHSTMHATRIEIAHRHDRPIAIHSFGDLDPCGSIRAAIDRETIWCRARPRRTSGSRASALHVPNAGRATGRPAPPSRSRCSRRSLSDGRVVERRARLTKPRARGRNLTTCVSIPRPSADGAHTRGSGRPLRLAIPMMLVSQIWGPHRGAVIRARRADLGSAHQCSPRVLQSQRGGSRVAAGPRRRCDSRTSRRTCCRCPRARRR